MKFYKGVVIRKCYNFLLTLFLYTLMRFFPLLACSSCYHRRKNTRERKIDEEIQRETLVEARRGDVPFILEVGSGYPAATALPGSIPTTPTKVQATLSLCLHTRSVCLPNLPSRAGVSREPQAALLADLRVWIRQIQDRF